VCALLDSAKTLAITGLGVVGRDNYGVFPLRGKLLNVREASHKQIMENAEINSIKQIMGLQHGKKYTDVSTLRYGHLMIMTDQVVPYTAGEGWNLFSFFGFARIMMEVISRA
jgi:DNA gyrase/topoisomerase IV subunit B